jgi:hypothetical protein
LFDNVTVTNTASEFKMYYASGVDMENVTITRTGDDNKPDDQYSYYADTFVNPLLWTGTASHTLGAADVSGTWDSTTSNWIAPFQLNTPWVENNSAEFGAGSGTNASPVTVTLAGPHTVDTITFTAGSPAYTLTSSSISLVGDGMGDGIQVNSLTATIASNIILAAGGTPIGINVASGGTLNLTGTWTNNNPTATLTKSGAGVVNMHNLSIAGLNITGGTLALTAGGGTAGSSVISGGTVSITSGALDLNDHSMLVEYGGGTSPVGDLSYNYGNPSLTRNYPSGSLQSYAQTAIGSGSLALTWTGPGLTSSAAAADYNVNGLLAVGIADENDIDSVYPNDNSVQDGGSGSWQGLKINDPNNVLVRLTYYGDGNDDGVVNSHDFSALTQGYSGLAGYVGWSDGDYNYDGAITRADVTLFSLSYQFQGAPLGNAISAGQAQYLLALDPDLPASTGAFFQKIVGTPEPASVAVLGATAAGLLARRRRRKF